MVSSSYYRLMKYLQQQDQDMLRLTFAEIEKILGSSLPPSAYEHRAWWANSHSHSHARHGWIKAGFETSNVDLDNREVSFVRLPPVFSSVIAPQFKSVQSPAPSFREAHRGRPQPDVDDLVRLAGGVENLAVILEAVQAYINGETLETELGRDLRRLWPRR